MSDNFPEVYKKRPLHDDWRIPWLPSWLQPWAKIPRRWTGLELYMPPRKVLGNQKERWIEVQEGYPLAPDAELAYVDHGIKLILAIDPVPGLWEWSIQSVYIGWLGFRIPCYFTFSIPIFGRRLHFNGFIKPDVTLGDWYYWLEMSLSYTQIQ